MPRVVAVTVEPKNEVHRPRIGRRAIGFVDHIAAVESRRRLRAVAVFFRVKWLHNSSGPIQVLTVAQVQRSSFNHTEFEIARRAVVVKAGPILTADLCELGMATAAVTGLGLIAGADAAGDQFEAILPGSFCGART
jgi:hypothetical protein